MKPIKAAVIDSGVNLEDSFFAGKKVTGLGYDRQGIKESGYDTASHGTNIIKKLLYEAPDTEIISIQILDDRLRGSLEDLCGAIKYSIEAGVDIINLSLGFTWKADKTEQKKVLMLKDVCDRAYRAGIAIFAADNNKNGISYPAGFDSVMGISSVSGNCLAVGNNLESVSCSETAITPENESNPDTLQIPYLHLDRINNRLIFSDSYVGIPSSDTFNIYHGNSYLTPLITALYSRYLNYFHKTFNFLGDFFDFLETNLSRDNINNFYLNKKVRTTVFNNSNILYLGNENNHLDRDLVAFLKDQGIVEFYSWDRTWFDDIKVREELLREEYHYIWFGSLREEAVTTDKEKVETVYCYALNSKKDIVMTMPLLPLFNRILLHNIEQIKVVSLYK
ncbi:S8 family serine peptidase [Anaerocolumna sp. AGMB13025]|uniref:S8 family peptidase n=1 Tax=Anaerocolumna sp. AGMB13025 TaxID=3039116 RepID=UPI00241EC38C|nr:S8 family serine peptidase [Anaerocolumna sp. AGMB13025]WFR56973.1 S8 family serine peptidase [Anaerocolumna sp. AGMB13025]